MAKILLYSLLVIVPAIGHLFHGTERVVGGNPTTIEQYPFMANVQLLKYGIVWSQECGGTLITSWTVLSTANCFSFYRNLTNPSWLWRVRLGSSFSSSGGSLHRISQFIIHEGYNRPTRLNNDVAIARLTERAVLSNTVNVALIGGNNYDLPDGTVVVATGWGHIVEGGPSSEQLQHVALDIINQNLCVERYARLKLEPGMEDSIPEVTPGMVCAGVLNIGGRDSCQGDSGGPLIHYNSDVGLVVMGMVSWGYSCGHYYYPGVNVRISHYSKWIVDNGSV